MAEPAAWEGKNKRQSTPPPPPATMLMTLYLSFARGPEPSGTSTLWRGEGGCRLFFPSHASRSKGLGAV